MYGYLFAELITLKFYVALLGIILVDLLLSGDNALVIAAVTSKLPPSQQRAGIYIGSSLAVALRVVLAFGAAWLLSWPGIAVLGGLYLIKVAYDLVKPTTIGIEIAINRILEAFPAAKWIGAVFLAGLAGKVLAHDPAVTWLFGEDDGGLLWTFVFLSISTVVMLAQLAWSRHAVKTIEESDERRLLQPIF